MKKEYFSVIQNPMTIIALFVGLTEIALGLVAVSGRVDQLDILVWFMVLFPTIVAIAFFVVLVRFPHHFYSPGDFRSDESYLSAHQLKDIKAFTHQSKSEMKMIPPSNETLKQMVSSLHSPLCFYLLKVANRNVMFDDHIALMRKELESTESKDEQATAEIIKAIGYVLCAWSNFRGVLFQCSVDGEEFTITVTDEVLSLLGDRVSMSKTAK